MTNKAKQNKTLLCSWRNNHYSLALLHNLLLKCTLSDLLLVPEVIYMQSTIIFPLIENKVWRSYQSRNFSFHLY